MKKQGYKSFYLAVLCFLVLQVIIYYWLTVHFGQQQ